MTICYDYIEKGAVSKFKHVYSQKHFVQKELKCVPYNNALVIPHTSGGLGNEPKGCVVYNGSVVNESLFHEEINPVLYDIQKENIVEFINQEVIFVGIVICIYGHTITDSIKKLWWLKTQQAKELISQGAILAFTTYPKVTEIPNFVKEIFLALGYDISNMLWIKEVTKCKMLYIPDNSLFCQAGCRWYTNEFIEAVNLIKQSACRVKKLQTFDKVYFSRQNLKNNRKDIGESIIVDAFKKKGFSVVFPETISFLEQVKLLGNCSVFASTEGSVSHNSMFTHPQTKVIIIRKADYVNTYQVVCNEIADSDVFFVDANKTLVRTVPWAGPFYLCMTKKMAIFLGERYFPMFWTNLEWWKYFYSYLIWKFMRILVKIKHAIKK